MKKTALKEIISKEVKQARIQKKASQIDWKNVVKGISWTGLEYNLFPNTDGTILCESIEESNYFTPTMVITGMDVYDKNGQCVSRWKDFK